MAQELGKITKVTAEELSRAKNSVKSSVWMNLECRQIVMEDVARQLLMSDKVVSGHEFCAAIDAVSEADITRVTSKLLAKNRLWWRTGIPPQSRTTRRSAQF